MEKALKYEYEDILSKTRKISSFKSRIVLYFRFMCSYLIMICVLPTYANSLKPSNHIVKKIPLRKATSQPGFQLSPFVEMFFESIPGLLIIFIPWDLYPKNILMWYT